MQSWNIHKNPVFLLSDEIFSQLIYKFFELNKFLVPTTNMSELPCDEIAREKCGIWKTPTFQMY